MNFYKCSLSIRPCTVITSADKYGHNYNEMWIVRREYDEYGSSIVHHNFCSVAAMSNPAEVKLKFGKLDVQRECLTMG